MTSSSSPLPASDHTVWQNSELANHFVETVRGAVPHAQDQIGMMLALLAQRETPLVNFVDLGCGDGILGAAVLERFPESRGVFADFSKPMLENCRQKLASFGNRVAVADIDYSQANWTENLAQQGPFDAVVSGYSIHHQPDDHKQTIYRDIFDLLSPGGWLVNIEHVAPASALSTELFNEEFTQRILTLKQRQGEDTTYEDVRKRFIDRADKEANILAPAHLQADWLRDIGFEDADVYFQYLELAVIAGRRP